MGLLRIVIDTFAQESIDNVCVVNNDRQYFAARRIAYQALEVSSNIEVTIVIRNRAFRQRFDDLRRAPGVAFVLRSPIEDVESRLGIRLPSGMSDEDVLSLDLIASAEHECLSGETGADWVARVMLGRVWMSDRPPSVDDELKEATETLSVVPLKVGWLKQYVDARLAAWKRNDRSRKWLWAYLESDPGRRAQALCAYAVLRNYPSPERARWLGPLWTGSGIDTFDRRDDVAVCLGFVRVPEGIREDLERLVVPFLRDRLDDGTDPVKVIRYATGALSTEVPFLIGYLKTKPSLITVDIVQRVSDLMRPGEDGAVIDQLRELLPVSSPWPLPREWTAAELDRVHRWFQDEYLPWYRAVRIRGDNAPEQDFVCESFAHWLKRAFPSLLRDPRATVLGVLDRVRILTDSGRSVILVIVDALGAEWSDLLIEQGRDLGMQLTAHECLLTLLPTNTAVAKPAIVCGRPAALTGGVDTTSLVSYRQLASGVDWGAPHGVAVGADWGDRSLQDIVSSERRSVWIHLANQVDEQVAHGTMAFVDRPARVKAICHDVLQSVRRAQDASNARYGVVPAVVITADHGFTSPAQNASLVLLPGGTVAEGDRCCLLDAETEAPLGEGWLVLDPPETYGVTHRYALAHGNRFMRNISLARAAHGGANPEEVFVPYIEFDGNVGPLTPPVVRFHGTLRPDISEQLCSLVVRNPNLRQLGDLSLHSPAFDVPIHVGRLEPGQSVSASALLRVSLRAGSQTLGITARFVDPSGDPVPAQLAHIEVEVAVAGELQQPARNRDDFERMFDA